MVERYVLPYLGATRLADLSAMDTGMRWGELAGLRWSDVDLDRGTPTVAQQRTTAGKETVTTTPKARSQRQLLLADATVGVLRDHLERQQVEQLAAGVAWAGSGYVFVDEAGVPLLRQRLTKMFASAIARADVPKTQLHDVRHTMATSALEAGASATVAARIRTALQRKAVSTNPRLRRSTIR